MTNGVSVDRVIERFRLVLIKILRPRFCNTREWTIGSDFVEDCVGFLDR